MLTSFLCSPPLPPPAGVDTTLPEVTAGVTTRERIERHLSDSGCAGCHRGMDGIGLSLEKLDWLGRYREREDGRDIDDRSSFPLAAGDVTVTGATELAAALAQEPEVAVCLSRQWLRYASGVAESADVRCLVERLASELRGPRGLERMILTALTSDFIRRGGDVP